MPTPLLIVAALQFLTLIAVAILRGRDRARRGALTPEPAKVTP